MFQNSKETTLLALALALVAPGAVALGVLQTCTNPQTSCGSAKATNTCCVNSPFGLVCGSSFNLGSWCMGSGNMDTDVVE